MQSGALLSTADLVAYSKCAQFHTVILSGPTDDSTLKQARRIIKKKGDINYQVPLTSLIWPGEELKNGTLLHIACIKSCAGKVSEELLSNGADFTIKNERGDTALHSAFKEFSSSNNKFAYLNNSHINSILSAHVKFGNSSNPCNNDGISHFHIACMANHVEAVEFFLENRVDMNQAVHQEAKKYSSFTPLHFAIEYFNVETVEVLLRYGVNKCTKNGYNMNPLQQLLNRRIDLLGSEAMHMKIEVKENLIKQVGKTGRIVFMLLGNNFLDKVDVIDSTGLTNFHLACMLQDLSKSLLEQVEDIHHCINIDSPIWPGYTALHFAASCNNMNIVELLVHKKGASMDVKNAEGFTPFDICIKNGHIEDIHAAIALKPEWANLLFSDNKTRLVDFIYALRDTTELGNFLRNCVEDNINMTLPSNSQLWPGYTLLHVAVTLSRKYKKREKVNQSCFIESYKGSISRQIKKLLFHGADVTQKDANGRTPLHHAFRENKKRVSKLLSNHHGNSANPVDEENLSHLHIFCAQHDEGLVRRLLWSVKDIDVNIPYKGEKDVQNIKPGWTPLNCASSCKNIREMLLQRGATEFFPEKDPYDTDTLHSACDKGDVDAVQRLLELGVDVNLAMDDGRTPLHIAVFKDSSEVVELLLQRGADLIAKDNNGHIPLHRVLSTTENVPPYRHLMISMLKQHDELQKRMEKETGMTMLHIACYMLDFDEVRNKLGQGVKVDARVHEDSKLWPGCTALHVLMTKVKDGLSKEQDASNVKILTELLLENGTDITMANADKDTAIHISYDCKDENSVSRTMSLLKHHHDFRINPVDSDGISHFHIAVMVNNVEIVEKFLEHGVNVNQPPDFFAKSYDGCTPLHMAINNMEQSKMRIVELLLDHGADVNLEDIKGNSALHKAIEIRSSRLHLMEKLLSLGANINSENIYGVTPFEHLLIFNGVSAEDIRLFLRHGCRVNVSNPLKDEGYLGIILAKNDKKYRDLLFEETMKARDVGTVNELGRTLIHNSVAIRKVAILSEEYVGLFNRFIGFGYDVDDQDRTGQTALHLATTFNNDQAVLALLNSGADSNILDSKDKSALSYALERCVKCKNHGQNWHYHSNIAKALVVQALKLNNLGLDIDRIDDGDITRSYEIIGRVDTYLSKDFFKEIDDAKDFTISPLQLAVGDFLSEKCAVIRYSRFSEESRDIIDRVFESIDTHYKEILPILKLQYRKAVARFRLVERVADLKPLLGFPMPTLCSDIILSFLTIKDLKNVVRGVDLLN